MKIQDTGTNVIAMEGDHYHKEGDHAPYDLATDSMGNTSRQQLISRGYMDMNGAQKLNKMYM